MTDKQLAVLLSSYGRQIKEEIDRLQDLLPPDSERHLEWWNKESDKMAYFHVADVLNLASGKMDKYEQRPTGDYVLLDDLKALYARLENAVILLADDNDHPGLKRLTDRHHHHQARTLQTMAIPAMDRYKIDLASVQDSLG